MHKTIFFKGVSLNFSSKICFENFSTQILPGSRIAIIGRNGSGKSSLLNIIRGKLQPSDGEINISDDICIGYVEQIIDDSNHLSGGQKFHKKLSQALAQSPDLLLLDEPTNHLDTDNRKSLLQMLRRYQGTLMIVSHDTELLNHCVDRLWHIDNNEIHEFTGSYPDYKQELYHKRAFIEKELISLKHDMKDVHHVLMKEQKRAAKSKAQGRKSIEQRKWPTVVSKSKASRSEKTSGKKKSVIANKRHQLTEQLSDLRLPKVILPKFSLDAKNIISGCLLSIHNADIGYAEDQLILKNINVVLSGRERIAICGKNASGKSTLLKAILRQDEIFTTGSWHLPKMEHMGYLDQHYATLKSELSVFDHIKELRPDWTEIEVRRHLNDFLFRKNDEVIRLARNLSAGEKARVCLSMIAARTPRLLVLDEITNNLD